MLTAHIHAWFIAGILLASVSAKVSAQVSVLPSTVEVSLASGGSAEITVTVFNTGADSAGFALSLAPAPSVDDPPEEPGTVLFTSENICCSFGDMTSTPDGRLFVERGRATYEFTPELEFVRELDTPQLMNLSAIVGISYDADHETLWWLDVQSSDNITEQAFLVEGTLDGIATGQMLPLLWDEGTRCGNPSGRPSALAYDAVSTAATTGGTGYFYYLDLFHDTVWGIDALGQVVEGYPHPMTDYAYIPQPTNPEGCTLGFGLDTHALGGEPVLESLAGYPFEHPENRPYTVVVTDRMGRNRGAETSLFDLPTPDDFGFVLKLTDVVRSRLDPSILYLTARTGFAGANARHFVYAVRAAPLPPVWLHGAPILFSVEGDSETEVTLTLDASGLEPGVYEGVVSVREEDGIGPVIAEVPVTLTVPIVENEETPAPGSVFKLGEPYPNPSASRVTLPVTLTRSATVRLVAVDVLGRDVVVLHDGPLAAGDHTLALGTAELPSGVYVLRAEAGGEVATERFTVLR